MHCVTNIPIEIAAYSLKEVNRMRKQGVLWFLILCLLFLLPACVADEVAPGAQLDSTGGILVSIPETSPTVSTAPDSFMGSEDLNIPNVPETPETIPTMPLPETRPDATEPSLPVHTHTYTEPSCIEPARCACGTISGSPLGHEEITDPAVAPTETTTGLTEGKHCSRCKVVLVPQKIIDALGPIDTTPYITLSNAEDIYALARILSQNSTKTAFFGSNYSMEKDLERFSYPDTVSGNSAKRAYLAGAAYKLTADITLTLRRANDPTYFMGIGSVDYPFSGL